MPDFSIDSYNPIDINRKWITFFTDFVHPSESNNLIPFDDSVSGTGAAITSIASTSGTEMGVINFTTGTTATGRATITVGALNMNTFYIDGSGQTTFVTKVKFSNLSDGTNTYTFRAGLIDSVSAESTEGVYFIYDSTSSANWRIIARSGGTGSAVSSGNAVDTNWNTLKFVINAAGTSVSFYLNGSLLTTNNTISSGIPSNDTSIGAFISKSVGTTARVVQMDFIGMFKELTTQRLF